jgi:hypothetical protein
MPAHSSRLLMKGIHENLGLTKLSGLLRALHIDILFCINTSVAEPYHFYLAPAPAPGKNFDAALAAPAPASTLLYSKAKFLK